jgi:WD40 repeat protein
LQLSGAEARRLAGDSRAVTSVAFSPDDRYVLTGSSDRTARLWAAATGMEVQRFSGHSDDVKSVAFSPDGRFVLAGSADGTARLWEAATGKWRAVLLSFRDNHWAVVDSEGRFDAAYPDNLPGMFWLDEGDQVISLGEIKQRYCEKGLLAKILRGEPLGKEGPPSCSHSAVDTDSPGWSHT